MEDPSAAVNLDDASPKADQISSYNSKNSHSVMSGPDTTAVERTDIADTTIDASPVPTTSSRRLAQSSAPTTKVIEILDHTGEPFDVLPLYDDLSEVKTQAEGALDISKKTMQRVYQSFSRFPDMKDHSPSGADSYRHNVLVSNLRPTKTIIYAKTGLDEEDLHIEVDIPADGDVVETCYNIYKTILRYQYIPDEGHREDGISLTAVRRCYELKAAAETANWVLGLNDLIERRIQTLERGITVVGQKGQQSREIQAQLSQTEGEVEQGETSVKEVIAGSDRVQCSESMFHDAQIRLDSVEAVLRSAWEKRDEAETEMRKSKSREELNLSSDLAEPSYHEVRFKIEEAQTRYDVAKHDLEEFRKEMGYPVEE